MFQDERERDSPEEIALYRTVAQRIRAARIRAGLNHAELADRLEMRKSYVIELERGVNNLTLRTLHRICSGIGIAVDELFPNSLRRQIDQLTLDALLDLCASIVESIDKAKAAADDAFEKDLDAVRRLQGALSDLDKGAPRLIGSDDQIQGEKS